MFYNVNPKRVVMRVVNKMRADIKRKKKRRKAKKEYHI